MKQITFLYAGGHIAVEMDAENIQKALDDWRNGSKFLLINAEGDKTVTIATAHLVAIGVTP